MEEQGYWARKRLGRRRLLGTTAVGAAGIAAAATIGCGDDDDGGGGTQATGTTAPAAGAIKRGGTLKLLVTYGDYGNEDPHQESTGNQAGSGSGLAYSQLMVRKTGPNISFDVIPDGDLAQKWEQPDDSTLIFTLRPNAKWHNVAPLNGRAVTAEDVAYSAKRQIDLKFNAAYWAAAKDFLATNPTTLRINLTKPDADFLISTTSYFNKVVPRENVEAKGDLKQPPVIGSGAWIFRERVTNQATRFVKNPEFYRQHADFPGQQIPFVDALETIRVADISTGMSAFRTGQVPFFPGTKADRDILKRENPRLIEKTWRQSGPLAGRTLILRADVAPTNDPRVRQAVNLIVNRKQIVDTVTFGEGKVGAGSMIAASTEDQFLPDAELERMLPYDPARAKQLLDAAGVGNWQPEIWGYISTGGSDIPELIHAELRKLGINGSVKIMDNVALGRWWQQRDLAFVPFIRGTSTVGVGGDITSAYKSGGGRNLARMDDPELDRMIDAQAAELKDAKRRVTILHDIQRRIITLGAMTPIYEAVNKEVMYPYVMNPWGIMTPGTRDSQLYHTVWLDQ